MKNQIVGAVLRGVDGVTYYHLPFTSAVRKERGAYKVRVAEWGDDVGELKSGEWIW